MGGADLKVGPYVSLTADRRLPTTYGIRDDV
jgi:hypothetical protein